MEWKKCVNCAIIFIYKYLEMGCQESIKQLWSFGRVFGEYECVNLNRTEQLGGFLCIPRIP